MSIGTMLFNPFTGKPRDPRDIASDPKGILVWDGEEPLRAASIVVGPVMTFTLDAGHINEFQVSSLRRVIHRAKHAHHTDIDMRINGKDERYEADWLKHLKEQP